MPKPPAFQFYADDFVSGTSDMTALEVGIYILLLSNQWTKGGLPHDEERLFRMARTNNEPSNEAAVRYVISTKFEHCEDGLLRNKRMEEVRAEQESWRMKSSTGGKVSAVKRVGDSNWGRRMAENRKSQRTGNEANNEAPSEPLTNSPSPIVVHNRYKEPARLESLQDNPPTMDECRDANSRLPEKLTDAELQKFFDHYQSQGWTKGNKMPASDLFSLMRMWNTNQRIYENNRPTGKPNPRNEFIATTPKDQQRAIGAARKIAERTAAIRPPPPRNDVAAEIPGARADAPGDPDHGGRA